jgi:hypothetical protein
MAMDYSYNIGGYRRPDQPDCQIICPLCAPRKTGADSAPAYSIIRFYQDDNEVRCPRCRRWYRVLTRKLADTPNQRLLPESRARYAIVTKEDNGRIRPRSFTGFPGWPLSKDEVISLVWFGPRFMGVANQTHSDWHGMPQRKFNSPFRLAWQLTFALIAALALYYGAKAAAPVGTALLQGNLTAWGTLVTLVLLMIAPAIRYALKR